jgi:hypothetical protein
MFSSKVVADTSIPETPKINTTHNMYLSFFETIQIDVKSIEDKNISIKIDGCSPDCI